MQPGPVGSRDTRGRLLNGLPNLQLLPGPINEAKQGQLPLEWAEHEFSDETARNDYLARHDLHGLPRSIVDFPDFYDARRKLMVDRLTRLLRSRESGSAQA